MRTRTEVRRRSDPEARLRSNRVDDRADPFHVPRGHIPSVDRRSIAREPAELDRRARRQRRGAHADRIMEREAEDRVREAVVLD